MALPFALGGFEQASGLFRLAICNQRRRELTNKLSGRAKVAARTQYAANLLQIGACDPRPQPKKG
jgi:hypothetical protein